MGTIVDKIDIKYHACVYTHCHSADAISSTCFLYIQLVGYFEVEGIVPSFENGKDH